MHKISTFVHITRRFNEEKWRHRQRCRDVYDEGLMPPQRVFLHVDTSRDKWRWNCERDYGFLWTQSALSGYDIAKMISPSIIIRK